jgi:hypothetical protein
MGESLDPPPPLIASSFHGAMLVRAIIIRAIIIIVSFIVSFALNTVSFLAPIFNLVACSSRGVVLLAEYPHEL